MRIDEKLSEKDPTQFEVKPYQEPHPILVRNHKKEQIVRLMCSELQSICAMHYRICYDAHSKKKRQGSPIYSWYQKRFNV